MLSTGERPRQLHWYHAGPMLFGDWGTSRLYVLGIAFYNAQYASFWYMLAMSVLLFGVGWGYEVICRHFPEGGGVYSAARQRSHFLGVVGALLLCADYVVTASLSALDAFHYLGLPGAQYFAAAAILGIGVVNYFGPTKAGTLAMYVAIATVICSLAIALFAIREVPSATFERPRGNIGAWWSQFTALILAISGVEAVANMTGIMVKPVKRTARLSIYPVLAEIIILNLVLTLAMQAIPPDVLGVGNHEAMERTRDTMLRVLATYYIGPTFAAVASLVFAALLLSAVNTAVTDLVSIQYMMAHDRELPQPFTGLNRWGMPVVGLVLGAIIPAATVLLVPNVGHLADLYAIGVVGAVAINLAACSTNFKMDLTNFERWPMLVLAGIMTAIWCTIAYEKPHALVFAGSIVLLGLAARYVAHNYRQIGQWMVEPIPSFYSQHGNTIDGMQSVPILRGADVASSIPVEKKSVTVAESTKIEKRHERIMVCTRGNIKLVETALQQAQLLNSELFVLFVRHLAIAPMGPLGANDGSDDPEALQLFAETRKLAAEQDITLFCLYAVSFDVADTILDFAVTHGITQLIMGTSQRGGLWRSMKGDVIQTIAEYLPESIRLTITA